MTTIEAQRSMSLSEYLVRDPYALYEERSLQTLVAALERTPMYRSWRAHDLGPGFAVDQRYRALPLLTKGDIRAHFPLGLIPVGLDLDAARARGEVSFVRTSGTADEAVDNIWNQAWWDASERAAWGLSSTTAHTATGTHREAILASALSVGPRSLGTPLERSARVLGRFLFLNEYGSTDDWPDGHEQRILDELADYQPVVLEANPSLLARLARWAARAGAKVWQPPVVTITYEFPSLLHLRAIRRVFTAPLVSSYGSTEAGYVFMECEHGRLHQNAEYCRVDMVPLSPAVRSGQVPPGGLGRIVATTFGNTWSPLLRFEVGDVGRLATEPCPCGRHFGLTLKAIEGRLKSVCLAGDGRLITHYQLDCALAEVDGLTQYRLDQDAPAKVRCSVISQPGREGRVVGRVREALAILFGPGVGLEVLEVSVLSPEPSGKFLLARRSFPLAEDSVTGVWETSYA